MRLAQFIFKQKSENYTTLVKPNYYLINFAMEKPIDLNFTENFQDGFADNSAVREEPAKLRRIDGKYIASEIGSVLNFDRGFFYTMRELLLRPGNAIRHFIQVERNRLVKPIIFIILTSFIYTLLREVLKFEDNYVYVDSADKSTSTLIMEWIIDNYGYGNIIMGVFIGLWTTLIFKKYRYNIYEILILLCYVIGVGMMILSLFGVVEGITKLKVLQFGSMVFLLYAVWAIGQFFDKKKYWNYVKALFAYLLGFISFIVAVLLIGRLIDIMLSL